MHYLIEHRTRLVYPDGPVSEHQIELRLWPREDAEQRIVEVRIEVEPETELETWIDAFGNRVHSGSILSLHEHLSVALRAEVEVSRANPFDYTAIPPQRELRWIQDALSAQPRLQAYVYQYSPATPILRELEKDLNAELNYPTYDPRRPLLESIQEAMLWIDENFAYDTHATGVHKNLEEIIALRAGVCQDFAHLLISVVRSWGVPARYVAGYQHPELLDDDAEPEPHAWAEVLIPGADWLGFDPTGGLVVNDRYVAGAMGRDSRDAAPLQGSFKGAAAGVSPEVMLKVEVPGYEKKATEEGAPSEPERSTGEEGDKDAPRPEKPESAADLEDKTDSRGPERREGAPDSQSQRQSQE